MKIFNIFKKKDEISDFWYENGSRYFYVPNTDLKINISASDALRIIYEYKTFKYWDAQDIFSRGFWKSNLDIDIIEDFINYHKKGLFDYALAWICDNDIECNNEDKFEYLSNPKFKSKLEHLNGFKELFIDNNTIDDEKVEICGEIIEESFEEDIEKNISINNKDKKRSNGMIQNMSNFHYKKSKHNNKQNFKYLKELINEKNEINLESDIILDKAEDEIFSKGVPIRGNDIIINGNNHIIDAKGKTRIFNIRGTNIILKNIHFKNGYVDKKGGGILIDKKSRIKLINNIFENNFSFFEGGAIYSKGNLKIINCIFKKNTAKDFGGAIYTVKENLEIESCEFNNNAVDGFGGALYNCMSKIKILNSKFENNVSNNGAGVLDTHFGYAYIKNTTFLKNGSFRCDILHPSNLSSLYIKNCTFKENTPRDLKNNNVL